MKDKAGQLFGEAVAGSWVFAACRDLECNAAVQPRVKLHRVLVTVLQPIYVADAPSTVHRDDVTKHNKNGNVERKKKRHTGQPRYWRTGGSCAPLPTRERTRRDPVRVRVTCVSSKLKGDKSNVRLRVRVWVWVRIRVRVTCLSSKLKSDKSK